MDTTHDGDGTDASGESAQRPAETPDAPLAIHLAATMRAAATSASPRSPFDPASIQHLPRVPEVAGVRVPRLVKSRGAFVSNAPSAYGDGWRRHSARAPSLLRRERET